MRNWCNPDGRFTHTRVHGSFSTLAACVTLLLFATSSWANDPASLTADPRTELTTTDNPQSPSFSVAGDIISVAAGPPTAAGLLGLTIVGAATPYVLVSDLFGAGAWDYGLDLSLGQIGNNLPDPTAGATTTGITWVDTTNTLWWVDATNNLVLETSLAGAPTGNVISLAGIVAGLPGGLCYDDVDDTLWINDIVNDVNIEFSFLGVATGSTVANPGPFGNGVAHVSGTSFLEVPTGGIAAGQVANVVRLDSTNGSQALTYPVANTFDNFINGVDHHPTGSTGIDVNYIVGNATNQVFEIETGFVGCLYDTVSGVLCSALPGAVTGSVTISYTENATYDVVAILRDGVEIANPTPGAGSFVDTPPSDAFYTYSVRTTQGGLECTGGLCTIYVPDSACDLISSFDPLDAPFGITVNETENTVLVSELFNGNARIYDRDLVPQGTIPSPPAAATTTGVAWHASDNSYYWVDATTNTLWQTNSAGVVLSSAPFGTPPSGFGLFGGLTISADNPDHVIVNDIVNDEYLRYDLSGNFLGVEFTHIDGGGFGNGIAALPAAVGFLGYELPTGATAAGQVDRIEVVDEFGNATQCTLEVNNGNFVDDTFLNGVALSGNGGAGCSVRRYVVGNASNVVYSNDFACLPCLPVQDYSCALVGTNASLTWTNIDTYDSHDILRNGVVIGSVLGGATSFNDSLAGEPFGQYDYTLTSTCTSGLQGSQLCTLFYIDPTSTDLVFNHNLSLIAADAISQQITALGRIPTVVGDITNPSLPIAQFERIWVTCGMFPDNLALSNEQGQALVDHMTSGTQQSPRCVYIEGGDVWGFDAATPFSALDHIADVVLDGATPGDLVNVVGTDSGVGLDLTGINDAYVGINDFIDHLDPEPAATVGAGVAASNSGGAMQPVVTVGDSTVSGIGAGVYRVLCQSFELAGATSPAALMTQYDGFLCPVGSVGPQFRRGDCDNNGGFSGLLDGLFALNFQFVPGSPTPPCLLSCDADDNGSFSGLLDGLFMLNFQFVTGATPIGPPFPGCGLDPNNDPTAMGCLNSSCP